MIDGRAVQLRLRARGFVVSLDGAIGPETYGGIFQAMGCPFPAIAAVMGRQAAIDFPKFAIDTPLRLSHFMAQAAHETGGFRYLTELGWPSYFARYDGRADLGNIRPGDGARFPGRGIFHLTGRDNYARMGPRLGLDLLAHPAKAAEPDTAVTIACLYWQDRGLAAAADRDDVLSVSIKVNGRNRKTGLPNHLAERKAALARAKSILM